MQMALQVILLLLAVGPPPADAAAPVGTCDKAGEGAPLPPTLAVGCGGSSIAGIVYAAWGTPTGACNPDGSGDATSFKRRAANSGGPGGPTGPLRTPSRAPWTLSR